MNWRIDTFASLNAAADSAKLQAGEYPILINGRVRRGTVSPVLASVEMDKPGDNLQGLYTVGQFLVLFADGRAYQQDMSTDVSGFTALTGWSPLDPDVERIWATLVPAGSSYTTFKGSYVSEDKEDAAAISRQTDRVMLVADGINRCTLVALDGSSRKAKTFSEWTIGEPEYVPIMKQPTMSGNKLYGLSPDGSLIYSSVSGRPLDFVVNRKSDGDKNGDATTTAKAVDYNPATSLLGSANGAVMVSTLEQTYIIVPDETKLRWGEPYLADSIAFPCGATNEVSWADIQGNTALITQSGIHDFNSLLSQKQEHRLNPLSEKIVSLLYGTQNQTAAINFDEYALFSMSTVYGDLVLVYDTMRGTWVGLDNLGGKVKQFAVMRLAGQQRLFYITWDNRLFEAYKGPQTAIRRLYLGSFTAEDHHRIHEVKIQLTNVRQAGRYRMTYFADSVESSKLSVDVAVTTGQIVEPPLPFVSESASEQNKVTFGVSKVPVAFKSGFLLEDSVDGDIANVDVSYIETKAEEKNQNPVITRAQNEVIYGIWSGPMTTGVVAPGTDLTKGEAYYIDGTVEGPGYSYTDTFFVAKHTHYTWTGTLYQYEYAFAALKAMKAQCDHVYCVGHAYYAKPLLAGGTIVAPFKSAMSKEENSNPGPFIEVTHRHRYYAENGVRVVNTGRNLADAQVEPDGVMVGSLQYNVFKESSGWLALLGTPYVDADGVYADINLKWPWATWGTKLMIAPRAEPIDRMQIDGFVYMELPQLASYGHWAKVRYDGFNIHVETITPTGSTNPFTIHL